MQVGGCHISLDDLGDDYQKVRYKMVAEFKLRRKRETSDSFIKHTHTCGRALTNTYPPTKHIYIHTHTYTHTLVNVRF